MRASIKVTEDPVSASKLCELVIRPDAGAVVTFEGRVRDHSGERPTDYLEYEAYAAMAERLFGAIAQAARERWPIRAMAIHHRVGRLEIGEVSVAIAVSSGHRDAAFAACRFAIDELKLNAPIWKKEVGADGSFWIEGPGSNS
ncbi:MAG: molybdenum cofactor biosynthesis protein MoaE [Acidobacteriota bacterium]